MMTINPNIIFLDIDGPVIPGPLYFIDPSVSMKRSMVSTIGIACLTSMIRAAGCKIVCNTMHNSHYVEGRSIKDDLIRHGIDKDAFHSDWQTVFGQFNLSRSFSRMDAINEWLAPNGDHGWVCFDDEKFTIDKRLIHIDFDHGITYDKYRKALKVFGIRNTIIL